MKIRSGFVSNSSSSSFVVIAPKETIAKVKTKLSPFGLAVVESIAGQFEAVTLGGKKFDMAQGHYSTEEFAYDAVEEFSKEGEEEANELLTEKATEEWSQFLEAVKKEGGIANEIGC